VHSHSKWSRACAKIERSEIRLTSGALGVDCNTLLEKYCFEATVIANFG